MDKETCCSEEFASLFCSLTRLCMYLLEGAGNFEWFWWKKERVFQRGGNYVLLVSKNMHVFARGGGNFELFWWTKKHVFSEGWEVCFLC